MIPTSMTDPIKETALRWADAIRTRKPENVLQFYHPEGVLWGTLSPVIRHGHPPILEYFIGFLKWEDLACTFIDGVVRVHDDIAFYSGTYRFSWIIGKKNIFLPARFSFVYKKEGEQWLIMEHHSSLFPELPFKVRKFIQSE